MDVDDLQMLDSAFNSQLKVDETSSVSEENDEAAGVDDGHAQCDNVVLDINSSKSNDIDPVACVNERQLSDSADDLLEDKKMGQAASISSGGNALAEHSGSSEDEEELLPGNNNLRPFRDDPDHMNAHIMRNLRRGRNTDSICSASTTTSVAPEVIKERVKKQFRSKEKQQLTRRIRKHGESAIQTKLRRDNKYDVQTSLDAGWY